jgi:hypothetical protein
VDVDLVMNKKALGLVLGGEKERWFPWSGLRGNQQAGYEQLGSNRRRSSAAFHPMNKMAVPTHNWKERKNQEKG